VKTQIERDRDREKGQRRKEATEWSERETTRDQKHSAIAAKGIAISPGTSATATCIAEAGIRFTQKRRLQLLQLQHDTDAILVERLAERGAARTLHQAAMPKLPLGDACAHPEAVAGVFGKAFTAASEIFLCASPHSRIENSAPDWGVGGVEWV